MKNNTFVCQLAEYFETFLPDVRKAKMNTIASYEDSFAIFFQFLYEQKNKPHYRITYKDFTARLFDEYLLWLQNERHYGDSSIRPRVSAIVSFLKYASRRDMSALHAYSVAKTSEMPKTARTAFPYFTLEEMNILLILPKADKYLGNRDLVLLSFLYETAARAQELCDLCVGDVRFSSPAKVRLTGKGGKTREIPISEDVTKLMRYHLKTHKLNNPESNTLPLFSSQTNEKMTPACVRSIVAKYVKQAKSENPMLFQEKNYSPHSFRHSKAVHMVESGVSLINIRNFLGHAFISSTEIYARIGQKAITKALTERKIPNLTAAPPERINSKCPLPEFMKHLPH